MTTPDRTRVVLSEGGLLRKAAMDVRRMFASPAALASPPAPPPPSPVVPPPVEQAAPPRRRLKASAEGRMEERARGLPERARRLERGRVARLGADVLDVLDVPDL